MLKNSNVEVAYSIERYIPDAVKKTINVELATGSLIDGGFVSDCRGLIEHTIKNIPDKTVQKVESLTVDASGQVTLSLFPIDNNPIEIKSAGQEGVAQDHLTGKIVDCANNVENDSVTVSYYYIQLGRDWFNEAASFVADDNPEYAGLNDYQYNSKRIWTILIEMGLVNGTVV